MTAPFTSISTFVTFFGALTLLLAGVGVYGVISYSFAQRTREIGLRMALGASRVDVAALVLKQIRTLLLAGLVPGLALAWTLGHALEAILFHASPADWRVYVAMCALLTAVALLASLLPARRATAIDPITAPRYE
jgi:ABC-type antimicrobial peptide transport system permease subunit